MKHTIFLLFFSYSLFGQSGKDIESDFLAMRKYVVGIGTVVNDTILINGKKTTRKRYAAIGAGLITYAKYDTFMLNNVVTAKHVIKAFIDNKWNSIFIRPSWADTIKTTDYFGVEIPLNNSDGTPNTFLYPDDKIDLGCILMLSVYFNDTYRTYAKTSLGFFSCCVRYSFHKSCFTL